MQFYTEWRKMWCILLDRKYDGFHKMTSMIKVKTFVEFSKELIEVYVSLSEISSFLCLSSSLSGTFSLWRYKTYHILQSFGFVGDTINEVKGNEWLFSSSDLINARAMQIYESVTISNH
jgi:hypothetical protein